MIVTDKKYFIENKLLEKLDMICDRVTKQKLDAWIIVDGAEGYGKSNFSVGSAYYCAYKTKRKFGLDNIFFDIDKFIEYVESTEKQVIIWDEAALGGLASGWQNKLQQKLIQLVMTVRKKRHIVFMNIPRFTKLNEYLAIDRTIGLVHVYARHEKQIGRFCYYKKSSKMWVYENYRKKKLGAYQKYVSFHGTFREALPLVLEEKEYDKRKDKAIKDFFGKDGKGEVKGQYEDQNRELAKKFAAKLRELGLSLRQIGEVGNRSQVTIHKLLKEPVS